MVGPGILFVMLASATAPETPPTPASLKAPPPALQLFERDWVLMNWALKLYDSNRDILLQSDEARAAADSFRRLADGDNDGRVTTEEYRIARESILAGR